MKNGDDNRNDAGGKPPVSTLAALGLIGQVGINVAGGALLGVFVGLFIDGKLHSSPVATLIGLLLGLAAGIYNVYRIISSL